MNIDFDSIIVIAFYFGIISALSLPLGALTTLIWKPSDRAIAFLMAFGGGALLAALTLDLVAGTVAKGYFYPLAAGCILGGLIFIVLNNIINDFGGFIRKASTSMYHLRKQDYRQFQRILSMATRADVFRGLSKKDFKVLAAAMQHRNVKQGKLIFTKGDPCDNLYLIDSGTVALLDPVAKVATKVMHSKDDLGWLAFITGTPYRFTARATTDVGVWVLPKSVFFSLLPNSPTLVHAIQQWLRGDLVASYLHMHHDLSAGEITAWRNKAVHALTQRGMFASPVAIDHRSLNFCRAASQFTGFDLLGKLPKEELQAVADRLIYKNFANGETFYHSGQEANYLYFIEQGSAVQLDAVAHAEHAIELGTHAAFGYMAFLIGGNHSRSAVATANTGVWVLRRKDFSDLLTILPQLAKQVQVFIQQSKVVDYLIDRQQLSQNSARKWVKQSLKSIAVKKTVVSARRLHFDISEHKGAPLGVWLGLMLDGIPEALVIGAGVKTGLSYSLLAGLFLSNYPEALSSSSGMRQHGLRFRTILFMWTFLMLMTGVISALGSIYFAGVGHGVFAFTEGVAAGAMLTMIAQTMLPEAYIKGGEIVGFSTLLGFLVAIFFKTLE